MVCGLGLGPRVLSVCVFQGHVGPWAVSMFRFFGGRGGFGVHVFFVHLGSRGLV